MKTYRRYLRIVLILLLAGLTANVAANLYFDPYRVFGLKHYNRVNFEPNTRYLKAEHLRQHPEIDAVLFGSSRAGFYDAAQLKACTGLNYYNYAASAAVIGDILPRVRWVSEGRHLKQAIFMVDYFMFMPGGQSPHDLLRKEHYLISGERPESFYFDYLLFQPHALKRVIRENKRKWVWYEFDEMTGQHALPWQEGLLAANPKDYVGKGFKLEHPIKGRYSRDLFKEFNELIGRLEAQGTEVIVVVNPCHPEILKAYDQADAARWSTALKSLPASRVWDFSGLNAVTSTETNYYDVLHFTHAVAGRVIDTVYGRRQPEGFGLRIK